MIADFKYEPKSAAEFYAAYHVPCHAPANAAQNAALWVDEIETPLGPMVSLADEQSLFLLEFYNRKNMAQQIARLGRYHARPLKLGVSPVSRQIRRELSDYFSGNLKRFETPLAFAGTEFQTRVWQGLQAIPYGVSCSYGQLAADIGVPRAVRAVAGSNARNALAIIVPCHRVIGKSGKLTGYAGGTGRKEALLRLEGVI